MRIAIDLSAVKTTGTKVYCNGFLPALGRLQSEDVFLLFMPQDVADALQYRLPENFTVHITSITDKMPLRILWQQTSLPRYLREWRADVLFAAFDMAPLLAPCPVLLAVRNPTPILDRKDVFPKGELHRVLVWSACRKARLIFYPSQYAAKRLGDTLNVPQSKRRVVYHGTDHNIWSSSHDPQVILSQYSLSARKYMLFVSQFYFYKHPEVLIDAFAQWREKTGRTDHKLVLVGGAPNKAYGQLLRQKVRDLQIERSTLFLSDIPVSDIATLYQQATAFVLPTEMETFGQPFVEAMSAGCPVICADTDFANELCREAALYFSPGDAQQLADLLQHVVEQPSVANGMRELGIARSQMFSWEREAEETLALLRQVGESTVTVKPATVRQ